jgi:hypothetical protein
VSVKLVLVVDKNLYFEEFEEGWFLDSGWLTGAQSRCQVVDFGNSPAWLGFVHPSRAEVGSWWRGGEGVWTVTDKKAPCQKTLKGYYIYVYMLTFVLRQQELRCNRL